LIIEEEEKLPQATRSSTEESELKELIEKLGEFKSEPTKNQEFREFYSILDYGPLKFRYKPQHLSISFCF